MMLYMLIPVYNEEQNVGKLLNDLGNFYNIIKIDITLKVIFVDDGSSDNTFDEILKIRKGFDLHILRHQSNKGPGGAFKTGFEYLSSIIRSEDYIVTMEGDNTSNLDTLKHMLLRIQEGYDVVLASPYLYGGGFSEVTFRRILISHFANGLIKLLLNLRGINTLSSFYRLYRGSIIIKLQQQYGSNIIRSKGFECMIELLIKLVRIHATISEVEMNLDWSARAGKSKMVILKTSMNYLMLIYKMKFHRL